jgi:tRNA(Ile2)-agmatinylcytidine synthase
MTAITKHIGLDDTDSTRRGCTTYIAALLAEKLTKLGATFIDYPSLVRLNPNVPWKTRGNGALCLRISHDDALELQIKETVVSTVEQHSDLENEGTDPGVVFFNSVTIPREIQDFAQNTITGISNIKEAVKLLQKYRGEAVALKDGRGIIGALAAVGETRYLKWTRPRSLTRSTTLMKKEEESPLRLGDLTRFFSVYAAKVPKC